MSGVDKNLRRTTGSGNGLFKVTDVARHEETLGFTQTVAYKPGSDPNLRQPEYT